MTGCRRIRLPEAQDPSGQRDCGEQADIWNPRPMRLQLHHLPGRRASAAATSSRRTPAALVAPRQRRR